MWGISVTHTTTHGHYMAQHHHEILFLLLSCWTRFSWLVLIRCCCCSCCGRFRCVVCRCCLRGSYLIQCWHDPSQFKLPLPSLTLSMWYVCGILAWFDTLYIWSTYFHFQIMISVLTLQAGQRLWADRKGSMSRSPYFQLSDSGPLVWRLWLIFQHLASKDDQFIIIVLLQARLFNHTR